MITDESGTKLCNFMPHVECIIEKVDVCKGKKEYYVRLCPQFDDGSFGAAMDVPQEKLDKFTWWKKEACCWLNPEISECKTKRYLENAVREALKEASERKVYQLSHTGMFMIKGEAIFYTGLETIRSPASTIADVEIEVLQVKKHLEIDPKLSEAEAVSKMFDFISLSPDAGRVLLVHKLIYLMYQAYVEAGKRPNVCVFLYGKTGTNKTTFSAFLTQMYNRSSGIINPQRLNASIPAAVEVLKEAVDDTLVLDDLFPADSNSIRKQQEQTFMEVVRYIADGTIPARMKGNKILEGSPKCGVVFTGEYIVGTGSDAARILPVEMLQPDSEKLKYFQDHPLIISTFYYFFIRWLVENYSEIVGLLKAWLCEYQKADFRVHRRLQETHFFFNTAYALLLQYCYEKNFLTEEDAKRLSNSFRDLLTALVQQQDGKVSQETSGKVESKNYWECIRTLYKNGQFSVADNVDSFNKALYDGVIHNNCLCLRREKLAGYFPEADIEDIVDELVSKGVLEVGKNNRTKQISALNGSRFYVIPLGVL
ncbi:MAG TPA: hypothetical protein DCZ91_25670 [Lachnospiraceae bacterium]|nr:hypothetical protein [Lachnospiraceae bacterium]